MSARKTAGWIAVCVGCVASAEGLRTVAYSDPVGIPTICFGETRGVKLGDKATLDQCKDMLGVRIQEFGRGVDRCITRPMSPGRKAAYTSFAYNVGEDTFCRSSVAWKFNGGDAEGSCDALLLYTKAKGITLPGLVKRREQERALCLS